MTTKKLHDAEGAPRGINPYDILPRDVADKLTDALARIVLAAARVRTERFTRERLASRQPGQVMLGPEHPDCKPR